MLHCLTLQTYLTILKTLMCVKKNQCGCLFEGRGIVGAHAGRKYDLGGKQDRKKRVTWRKQKRRLPYLMIGKK